MSITKALKDGAKLAVFTRNYKDPLRRSLPRVERGARTPDSLPRRLALVVSRAGASTTFPDRHLFRVVDSGSDVQYAAKLQQVIVDPQRGQPQTEQLLELSTSTTGDEGLWENTGKPAGTLYAINHLERVSQPFRMTELIKVSDDQPISADYGYSYTLVYAR